MLQPRMILDCYEWNHSSASTTAVEHGLPLRCTYSVNIAWSMLGELSTEGTRQDRAALLCKSDKRRRRQSQSKDIDNWIGSEGSDRHDDSNGVDSNDRSNWYIGQSGFYFENNPRHDCHENWGTTCRTLYLKNVPIVQKETCRWSQLERHF
jgi:hypothetical protein